MTAKNTVGWWNASPHLSMLRRTMTTPMLAAEQYIYIDLQAVARQVPKLHNIMSSYTYKKLCHATHLRITKIYVYITWSLNIHPRLVKYAQWKICPEKKKE